MKRIFLAAGILTAGLALNAQEITVQRMIAPTNNAAYTVPPHVHMNFQATYPNVTEATWEPVSGTWRASYRENNRTSQVFYAENGASYRVALPVLVSYVPEEVVTTALDKYGDRVYSISMVRSADNSEVYNIRLLGDPTYMAVASEPVYVWLTADGTEIAETDVYKVKMDEDGLKIKSDDEKIKIKSDDSEMKIKSDDGTRKIKTDTL